MIFSPLIVVASELGLGREPAKGDGARGFARAYGQARRSQIGTLIVDCVSDAAAAKAASQGAYVVRTDPTIIGRNHNYRTTSGAERIAATVNRFDRYYTHDIVVSVPDHMRALETAHIQALMYVLASSEVGIATIVTRLAEDTHDDSGAVKAEVNWNEQRVVHPLPESRIGNVTALARNARQLQSRPAWVHVPVYAYRRAALDRLVNSPPTAQELREDIELLRAMALGIRIDACLIGPQASGGAGTEAWRHSARRFAEPTEYIS